jgi:hypothetical protein
MQDPFCSIVIVQSLKKMMPLIFFLTNIIPSFKSKKSLQRKNKQRTTNESIHQSANEILLLLL